MRTFTCLMLIAAMMLGVAVIASTAFGDDPAGVAGFDNPKVKVPPHGKPARTISAAWNGKPLSMRSPKPVVIRE